MGDHRVRLNDVELDLIVGALRARAAGLSARKAIQLLSLANRLETMAPGNPEWVANGGGMRYAAE